jgi:hypothetical protein
MPPNSSPIEENPDDVFKTLLSKYLTNQYTLPELITDSVILRNFASYVNNLERDNYASSSDREKIDLLKQRYMAVVNSFGICTRCGGYI